MRQGGLADPHPLPLIASFATTVLAAIRLSEDGPGIARAIGCGCSAGHLWRRLVASTVPKHSPAMTTPETQEPDTAPEPLPAEADPGRRRAVDVLSIIVGVLVLLGFATVLIVAPTTSSPPEASRPISPSPASSTPNMPAQGAKVADYPSCGEVSDGARATTCQAGRRVLTIGSVREPVWVGRLGLTVTRITVTKRGDRGARRVRATVFTGTRADAPREQRRLRRGQFSLGLGQTRYPPRSLRPGTPVPVNESARYRLTFDVSARVARRQLKEGRDLRLTFATFGRRVEGARRLGVVRLEAPALSR